MRATHTRASVSSLSVTAVRSQCDFLAVRFSSSVNFLATIWPLIEILRSLVLCRDGGVRSTDCRVFIDSFEEKDDIMYTPDSSTDTVPVVTK